MDAEAQAVVPHHLLQAGECVFSKEGDGLPLLPGKLLQQAVIDILFKATAAGYFQVPGHKDHIKPLAPETVQHGRALQMVALRMGLVDLLRSELGKKGDVFIFAPCKTSLMSLTSPALKPCGFSAVTFFFVMSLTSPFSGATLVPATLARARSRPRDAASMTVIRALFVGLLDRPRRLQALPMALASTWKAASTPELTCSVIRDVESRPHLISSCRLRTACATRRSSGAASLALLSECPIKAHTCR